MRVAAIAVAAIALAPAAHAGILLGVHGDAGRFAAQTGQQSQTNGTLREAAHSARWSRKAITRIAVIVRGGTRDDINARLAKLGLPGVARTVASSSSRTARVGRDPCST